MNASIDHFDPSVKFLRAGDVALRLNISRSLAYQLMQSGKIPTVRMNRTVRVKESDLYAYIQKCWSGWDQPEQS